MVVLLKRYDVTNGYLGQTLAVDWTPKKQVR